VARRGRPASSRRFRHVAIHYAHVAVGINMIDLRRRRRRRAVGRPFVRLSIPVNRPHAVTACTSLHAQRPSLRDISTTVRSPGLRDHRGRNCSGLRAVQWFDGTLKMHERANDEHDDNGRKSRA